MRSLAGSRASKAGLPGSACPLAHSFYFPCQRRWGRVARGGGGSERPLVTRMMAPSLTRACAGSGSSQPSSEHPRAPWSRCRGHCTATGPGAPLSACTTLPAAERRRPCSPQGRPGEGDRLRGLAGARRVLKAVQGVPRPRPARRSRAGPRFSFHQSRIHVHVPILPSTGNGRAGLVRSLTCLTWPDAGTRTWPDAATRKPVGHLCRESSDSSADFPPKSVRS